MDYTGSCLCATVKFAITGNFDSFYLCYCQFCQKDTGSAHAANLFSQSAKLTWLTGAHAVTSYQLPKTQHQKSFCKFCGSALPSLQQESLLLVPAGCLDTQISILPNARIFTSSQAAWVQALDKIPEFKTLPFSK